MIKQILISVLILSALNALQGQSKLETMGTKLFAELPESCPTPDSFTLTAEGTLLLTCPNYAAKNAPGSLLKWSDNEFVELGRFYLDGEVINVRPMGIVGGEDGNLFMCGSVKGQGMIFSVEIGDEKIHLEVVATGLKGANGIRRSNGSIYVTTPTIPILSGSKNVGGLYRFDEKDRNIQISGDSSDVNLMLTMETQNPKRQFGLDGIAVNKQGDIFITDFGDAKIYKLKIRKGKVIDSKLFAQLPLETGLDGICFGPDNTLYGAGFSQNEIWQIDPKGNSKLLAKNSDSNGENGALDQPADVFVYDGKLLISNFDLMVTDGMINTAHGKPYTISYIELK